MIGCGIYIFLAGLCFISEGGIFLIIIGIILFIAGISESANNSSGFYSNNNYDKKIDYIIDFYSSILESTTDLREKRNILQQLEFYQTIRYNYYNLNAAGRNQVDKTYNTILQIIEEVKSKIEYKIIKYEKYHVDCPLPISGENIIKLEENIKNSNNLEEIDMYGRVLNFLMLINNNHSIAKDGYSELALLPGMPANPEQIHIIAMQALMLKLHVEEMNKQVLNYIYDLFDPQLMTADTKQGEIKRLIRKKTRILREYFEKNEDQSIIPILMILDPTYMSKYNPNKKNYEILGLPSNATSEEIEQAYKKLLITKHPDRGGNVEEWSKINEAYTKIKDEKNEDTIISEEEHINSSQEENIYKESDTEEKTENSEEEDISEVKENQISEENFSENKHSEDIQEENNNEQEAVKEEEPKPSLEYECPKCKATIHYMDESCSNCKSQIKWIEKNN